MKAVQLKQLAAAIHQANKEKGFWDESRNMGELFMLIVSEASEALEAHRKGRFSDKNIVNSDFFLYTFKNGIKDTFEDELADIVIRVLDFCGWSKTYLIDSQRINIPSNIGETLLRLTGEIFKAHKAFIISDNYGLLKHLGLVVSYCFSIASAYDIPLKRHIELKLKYNQTRPYKHGKKY